VLISLWDAEAAGERADADGPREGKVKPFVTSRNTEPVKRVYYRKEQKKNSPGKPLTDSFVDVPSEGETQIGLNKTIGKGRNEGGGSRHSILQIEKK